MHAMLSWGNERNSKMRYDSAVVYYQNCYEAKKTNYNDDQEVKRTRTEERAGNKARREQEKLRKQAAKSAQPKRKSNKQTRRQWKRNEPVEAETCKIPPQACSCIQRRTSGHIRARARTRAETWRINRRPLGSDSKRWVLLLPQSNN